MKTTATNRKIRQLVTAIREQTLIPDPAFQRRLVWTNRDKLKFIETVLSGYPFPEIYIAAGDVDLSSGTGTELLVDGQQRVTTLVQYFTGSKELGLNKDIRAYAKLTPEEQKAFLEYEVVVRDLGSLGLNEIKEVFTRINSTKYSLNAMEIDNARYDGALKQLAERLSEDIFFERNYVFNGTDYRRMNDVRFVLSILVTILKGVYFDLDDELAGFLSAYNDEFPESEIYEAQLKQLFEYVSELGLGPKNRIWKKADLFTVLVELYRALSADKLPSSDDLGYILNEFYTEVDGYGKSTEPAKYPGVAEYYNAALQGTNGRSRRIERGRAIEALIQHVLQST